MSKQGWKSRSDGTLAEHNGIMVYRRDVFHVFSLLLPLFALKWLRPLWAGNPGYHAVGAPTALNHIVGMSSQQTHMFNLENFKSIWLMLKHSTAASGALFNTVLYCIINACKECQKIPGISQVLVCNQRIKL